MAMMKVESFIIEIHFVDVFMYHLKPTTCCGNVLYYLQIEHLLMGKSSKVKMCDITLYRSKGMATACVHTLYGLETS